MQQEMFDLVERWRESPLGKTDFLNGTGISKDKFNYWVTKYNKIHFGKKRSKVLEKVVSGNFREVVLPQPEFSRKLIFELSTVVV